MTVTAIIKPFKGYLYNEDKAGELSTTLAPPYDVLSPEQQKSYYSRSDYNIVKVDYRIDEKGEDKYEAAGKLFNKWVGDGILVEDLKPCIYVIEKYFIDWEGIRRVRRGFIAVLKTEEFGNGSVYPHEKTFSKHKEDRLKLFLATGAQFNPVFSIFPDTDGRVSPILKHVVDQNIPDINFRFHDGVTTSLWKLSDEKQIAKITSALADQPVFIADGHHRYETSLNYAREMKKKLGIPQDVETPYDYTLMYFVSMEDDGLAVLSAHRMLKNLEKPDEKSIIETLKKDFVIRKSNRNEALESLSRSTLAHALVLQVGSRFHILRPKEESLATNEKLLKLHESLKDLEVSICQEMAIKPLIGDGDLLDHMGYEIDPVKVSKMVESSQYQAAFYLPSTPIRQMTRVARAMQVMPHKSTYFYPKLLTGLVIHRFSE